MPSTSSAGAQENKPENAQDQPGELASEIDMSEPRKQGTQEGLKKAPQHQPEASQHCTPAAAAGAENIENIDDQPRQVIAVSASKGPAAFFNLARKFLVTDEYCDLSALEGAIVAAVDAAHLLERSKLATIVRYVGSAWRMLVQSSTRVAHLCILSPFG